MGLDGRQQLIDQSDWQFSLMADSTPLSAYLGKRFSTRSIILCHILKTSKEPLERLKWVSPSLSQSP